MRLWTMLLIAAVIGTAEPEKKQERSESASGKTTVVKLPVNAVRVADGLYRFTDPDGQVWLYRRTPFGYAKSGEGQAKAAAEDVPAGDVKGTPFSGAAATGEDAAAKSSPVAPVLIKATEEGDSIRFERPTPFGKTQWVKRKSELTAEETRIWEAQKPKAPEPDGK